MPFAFFFSRIPIFLLYRRIFYSVEWLRYACVGGMVATFLVYLHTVPLVGVFCFPRDGDAWTSMNTFERCSNLKPDSMAQELETFSWISSLW